jgi:XTP/dITP diphosphohydrolase
VNRLLVATTNRGKLAELMPMLAPLGIDAFGLDAVPGVPVAPEERDSFAGNARDKALHYARLTGLDVRADDSGLEVAALDGAPGVHSARFAGPDADDATNRARLLTQLDGIDDRSARFVCALCLVEDGAPVVEVEGVCPGSIGTAERGQQGFGYDPLFLPDATAAEGRTFAEMPREDKARISHRGRALTALLDVLSVRAKDGPR